MQISKRNLFNSYIPTNVHDSKTEKLLLDTDIYKYHFVSQGKIEIPGVDDAEEARLTDVKYPPSSAKLQFIHSGPSSAQSHPQLKLLAESVNRHP